MGYSTELIVETGDGVVWGCCEKKCCGRLYLKNIDYLCTANAVDGIGTAHRGCVEPHKLVQLCNLID